MKMISKQKSVEITRSQEDILDDITFKHSVIEQRDEQPVSKKSEAIDLFISTELSSEVNLPDEPAIGLNEEKKKAMKYREDMEGVKL